VLADTGHTKTPETIAQWQERIRTAETKGMQPLVDATLARWFHGTLQKEQAEIVEADRRADRLDAVAGYVGCCHAISKLSTTAPPEGHQGPRCWRSRRAGRGGARHPYIRGARSRAKLVVIPQAAHIANVEQPEAFNRALRDSFHPCQRASLAEVECRRDRAQRRDGVRDQVVERFWQRGRTPHRREDDPAHLGHRRPPMLRRCAR